MQASDTTCPLCGSRRLRVRETVKRVSEFIYARFAYLEAQENIGPRTVYVVGQAEAPIIRPREDSTIQIECGSCGYELKDLAVVRVGEEFMNQITREPDPIPLEKQMEFFPENG